MEYSPWHIGQSLDGRSCDAARRVDAQTKTLGVTARAAQLRTAYRARVAARAAADFVVVDECGNNVNRTPLYARAPRGERAIGAVPRNTEKNTTLLASMTTAGMGPAMIREGATDAAACAADVEHFLVPSLKPGNVVVLDNLSAPKSGKVRTLIAAKGCALWYLPAYAPALSPIEEAFSKLKDWLRRAEARPRAALYAALATALTGITALDAQGYFRHGGYGIKVQ